MAFKTRKCPNGSRISVRTGPVWIPWDAFRGLSCGDNIKRITSSSVIRGDQIFFSATCPGQVASKNPLVLKYFLLVPKYFSNHRSISQIANTTISYSKCNSNQYMRVSVT